MNQTLAGLLAIGGLTLWGALAIAWGLGPARRQHQARIRRLAPLVRQHTGAEPDADEAQSSIVRKRRQENAYARWLARRFPLVLAARATRQAVVWAVAGTVAGLGAATFLQLESTMNILLAGLAGAFVGVRWRLRSLQLGSEIAFMKQFPEIVDQMVRLGSAGVPALESLRAVSDEAGDPIGPRLREICENLQAGLPLDEVLGHASARTRTAEFTMFTSVLRLQARSGGGITDALGNLAETLRERRRVKMKAQASTAQTRLTLLILSGLPAFVIGSQQIVAPESVALLFATESGTTILRWGTGLIVSGLLIARWVASGGDR